MVHWCQKLLLLLIVEWVLDIGLPHGVDEVLGPIRLSGRAVIIEIYIGCKQAWLFDFSRCNIVITICH